MKKTPEIFAATSYALVAWAISAAVFSLALFFAHVTMAALVGHALAVPLAFALASLAYFRRRDALSPLVAAAWFGAVFLLLEAVAARRFDARETALASLLPAAAAVLATWLTGIATREANKGVST